ncbi:TRAP transporter small permease [Paracoccus sp. (in: a-proteobacteria)]|uniref:TRAP transporter small permease n=1 Tax=Paracoccus sp. TaxID=267 RepID=UPI003A888A94
MQRILKAMVIWMGRIEMALSMILLILIVATIAMQIVARYVFSAPVPWMEESVTIMFIYVTLLSAAVVAREKRHIVVDLFPAGPLSRRLGVAMSVLTIAILVLVLTSIGPIVTVEMRRNTVSLPWNFPLAWYNSFPLIYCFGSIILSIAYDLIFERKAQQEALV